MGRTLQTLRIIHARKISKVVLEANAARPSEKSRISVASCSGATAAAPGGGKPAARVLFGRILEMDGVRAQRLSRGAEAVTTAERPLPRRKKTFWGPPAVTTTARLSIAFAVFK
jgi:hypothetical protein